MRWEHLRRSRNVDDRRGQRSSGGGMFRRSRGSGRMRLGRKTRGSGIGVIVIALVAMYFGVDPAVVLNQSGVGLRSPEPRSASYQPGREENQLADFVSAVLADTEDTWHQIFRASGKTYQEPGLVLFSGAVKSACGLGEAAMGPFYCPGDHQVYIDLSFYQDLKQRHGAPGDFAQAYVVAHEVAHHVQNLLGISTKVHKAKRVADKKTANALSVKLELQADCMAGIWAHHAHHSRQLLEAGDMDEALAAASAIGDDRLQKQARGYVTPDSFTHGSSAQRVRWFKTGFNGGSLSECNTFGAARL